MTNINLIINRIRYMQQIIIYSLLLSIPFVGFYILNNLKKSKQRVSYDVNTKIKELSIKIQLDPKDTLAFYERGLAYLKSNNRKLALEDLRMAASLGYSKADDVIINNNLSEFTTVINNSNAQKFSPYIDYSKSQEYEGALRNYDKVINADPNNSVAYFMRADVKEAYKDHLGALEDLTNAIKYNRKYAQAYFKRGNIKLKLHDISGAKTDLEMAKVLGFSKANKILEKLDLEIA